MLLSADRVHPSAFDPALSAISFLNEVAERHPNAISFAAGRPDLTGLDLEVAIALIRRYADELASGEVPARVRDLLFQYGPAAGQIRELIAESVRTDEGIEVDPASIVVTLGAQEAMALTIRAVTPGPSDALLVPSPCYAGVTGAACVLGVPVVHVDQDEEGLSPQAVEAAIARARRNGLVPRALYVNPDFSNPAGTTLPMPTRQALLEIAERHQLIVIEDSPYRLVTPASNGRLPTLKSLDACQHVVHVGSYSKTIFPGARVGFAIADQPILAPDGTPGLLADVLAAMKSLLSLNTPTLSQAVVAGALLECGGRLGERTEPLARRYDVALRTLLAELDDAFGGRGGRGVVSWNRPAGGFFVVMTTPFVADQRALAISARDHGVLWTPMSFFRPGGGERQLRLSASSLTPAQIRVGVCRLAGFVAAMTAADVNETNELQEAACAR